MRSRSDRCARVWADGTSLIGEMVDDTDPCQAVAEVDPDAQRPDDEDDEEGDDADVVECEATTADADGDMAGALDDLQVDTCDDSPTDTEPDSDDPGGHETVIAEQPTGLYDVASLAGSSVLYVIDRDGGTLTRLGGHGTYATGQTGGFDTPVAIRAGTDQPTGTLTSSVFIPSLTDRLLVVDQAAGTVSSVHPTSLDAEVLVSSLDQPTSVYQDICHGQTGGVGDEVDHCLYIATATGVVEHNQNTGVSQDVPVPTGSNPVDISFDVVYDRDPDGTMLLSVLDADGTLTTADRDDWTTTDTSPVAVPGGDAVRHRLAVHDGWALATSATGLHSSANGDALADRPWSLLSDQFVEPAGIKWGWYDDQAVAYVADYGANCLKRVTLSDGHTTTTWCGDGTAGPAGDAEAMHVTTLLAGDDLRTVASDGTDAFYTDGRALMRVPATGGTPEVIADEVSDGPDYLPRAATYSDGTVYIAAQIDDTLSGLLAVDVATGTTATVAEHINSWRPLRSVTAAPDGIVYWLQNRGHIVRYDPATGNTTTITDSSTDFSTVTSDEDRIYYTMINSSRTMVARLRSDYSSDGAVASNNDLLPNSRQRHASLVSTGDHILFGSASATRLGKVDRASGQIASLAGIPDAGDRDGVGSHAWIGHAQDLALVDDSRVLIADQGNNTLRLATSSRPNSSAPSVGTFDGEFAERATLLDGVDAGAVTTDGTDILYTDGRALKRVTATGGTPTTVAAEISDGPDFAAYAAAYAGGTVYVAAHTDGDDSALLAVDVVTGTTTTVDEYTHHARPIRSVTAAPDGTVYWLRHRGVIDKLTPGGTVVNVRNQTSSGHDYSSIGADAGHLYYMNPGSSTNQLIAMSRGDAYSIAGVAYREPLPTSRNHGAGLVAAPGRLLLAGDRATSLLGVALPEGPAVTLAGMPAAGSRDGVGHAAWFEHVQDLTVTSGGTAVLADRGSGQLLRVTPSDQGPSGLPDVAVTAAGQRATIAGDLETGAVTTDGTYAYFTDGRALKRAELPGLDNVTTVTPEISDGPDWRPFAAAYTDGTVFVAAIVEGQVGGTNYGEVLAVDTSTGQTVTVAREMDSWRPLRSVATSPDGDVYWLHRSGTFERLSAAGHHEQVPSSTNDAVALAADGTTLFAADTGGSWDARVWRFDRADDYSMLTVGPYGGPLPASRLATNGAVVSQGDLVIGSHAGDVVLRVTEGAPETLADGFERVQDVAVTPSGGLLVADRGDHTVTHIAP
jgi:hypothetical protein